MSERKLGVLRLDTPVRAVPEYYELPVDVGTAEPLQLKAYPKGPATPLSVLLDEDAAYAEWNDAMPSDEDKAALSPRRYLARVNRAELEWRVNLLRAAIPDLTEEQAGNMVADDGPWRVILERLKFLEPLPAADAAQEAPADPEAGGEAAESVGQTASPDSAPTTPDRTLEA